MRAFPEAGGRSLTSPTSLTKSHDIIVAGQVLRSLYAASSTGHGVPWCGVLGTVGGLVASAEVLSTPLHGNCPRGWAAW